jgi:hypothetical protein
MISSLEMKQETVHTMKLKTHQCISTERSWLCGEIEKEQEDLNEGNWEDTVTINGDIQ